MSQTITIEVIRNAHPVMPPKVVMIDFDGTISLIAQGWRELMVTHFVELLLETPRGKLQGSDALSEMVGQFIDENTGKPTILQMQRIAREITAHSGRARTPEEHFKAYNAIAVPVMIDRINGLYDGTIPRDTMLVDGTVALLETFRRHQIPICLASGSYQDFVEQECDALRITEYFDAGIYGAMQGNDTFKKSDVIQKLLAQFDIAPQELLGIGDGHAETRFVHEVGGFTIGVASDELRQHPIDLHKRRILINAGADLIIPNYENIELLENQLFPLYT